jgi:hypothetical protein
MKKQKKISYIRKDDVIETGSIHPDEVQGALKELASCLKGLDIEFISLFGTFYISKHLSDDEILMINLTIDDDYKIVAE